MISKLIERRLGGYQQQLNDIDDNLPEKLSTQKKVGIIGAGLAGMAAAAYLAPRGFAVDVYEKESYIGGKIGSWPIQFADGYQTNVEHGFHGFFRQYLNLRRLLNEIDAAKYLIPIDDYMIKTLSIGEFRFQQIATTPIVNLLSMARRGIYSMRQMMSQKRGQAMLPFLKYDAEKTFEKYDQVNFEDFINEADLPKSLQLIFTTFARAFFAEPKYMSLAELMKSFHYYYLSNDMGILYDVLDDDFEKTLWRPFLNYLKGPEFSVKTESAVDQIGYQNGKFVIKDQTYDYLIIASDVKHTPKIIKASADLSKSYPAFAEQLGNLKTSQKYAVLRIWIDKDIQGKLPFFIFTDAVKVLDSVTIYHQMEKTSAEWVKQNGGGIFELHSYAVPDDMTDGNVVRQQLLSEFEQYFPEIKGYQIKYDYFQFRDDFTAFHSGLYKDRPAYQTEVPNLFLAGDWVKLPNPSMLMEAATTSALYSANAIFEKENLRQEPVLSVPLKGLLA